MSTPRVSITPAVLQWAIARTGLADDEIEKRFPRLTEWLEGETQPTLGQARELAHRAHIPFGRLLLKEPSGEDTGVPDFRTVKNSRIGEMSPDLREVVVKAQQRLAWYSDYAREEGIPAPAIFSSAEQSDKPFSVTPTVREKMGFGRDAPIAGPDRVRNLVLAMEDAGILVSRNSIVEGSTKRKLRVQEFRGFTIEDDGFCLVFINTQDSKTAQLFSLAHELGHVVLGKPGVSDHSDNLQLEQWCNRFASEFIAPPQSVRAHHDAEQPLIEAVEELARRFGMSREAMLWRLVELKLRSYPEAQSVLPVLKNTGAQEEKRGDGAPPHHVLVRARVGGRFYDHITQAAENGQISTMDAARYLGARSHESFKKLADARQGLGREAI